MYFNCDCIYSRYLNSKKKIIFFFLFLFFSQGESSVRHVTVYTTIVRTIAIMHAHKIQYNDVIIILQIIIKLKIEHLLKLKNCSIRSKPKRYRESFSLEYFLSIDFNKKNFTHEESNHFEK